MELTLDRFKRRPTRTAGVLDVDARPVCYVVEDTVRDRDTDGDGDIDAKDVAAFKVQGETAIPAGRYEVTLETSPKYGPDTLTVNGVPGFTSIRMHPGNDEKDTEGCLILGYQLTPNLTIAYGTTKPAVADLKEKVKAAIARGEKVWLTVRDDLLQEAA